MNTTGEVYRVNSGPASAAGAGGAAGGPARPAPLPGAPGAPPPGAPARAAPPPRGGALAGAGQGPAPPPTPPPRAPPGGMSVISVGCSFETMYIMPFCGSTAERPQFVPPLWPGIWTEPRRLGGVNSPSLRQPLKASLSTCCSAAGMCGLMSRSVNDCLANAGGLVGTGCVGDDHSPGTSDCGTGRSSIGHSGSPVLRLNTKRNPCLVAWATTSTSRPS